MEFQKSLEIERLLRQLDTAQAVHAAMVGSTYDKRGRNLKAYRRWIRSLIRRIKKLDGQKDNIVTVWDRMGTKRKSKKLGR